MLAQVVAAAAQRARRAGRDEQVVKLPVERLVDLAHRAGGVRSRVRLVRVLIGPEGVGRLLEQPVNRVHARDEEVSGLAIGLRDHADVGAERAHGPHTRSVRATVDDDDQSHAVVAAGLREPDSHVARA